MLLCLLVSGGAKAQDRPYSFPINVFLRPEGRSSVSSLATVAPLDPALLDAIRQGALDWNRLAAMGAGQAAVLALRRRDDGAQSPAVLFAVVDSAQQADLVVEPVEMANLDGKGRTSLWTDSSGNYLGLRYLSTRRGENNQLNYFEMRRRTLQQLGTVLGLALLPVTQKCNPMSIAQATCSAPLPGCPGNRETVCLSVQPAQIEQLHSLLASPIALTRPQVKKVQPAYPEVALDHNWTGRTVVRVYITRLGKAEQARVFTSSGHSELDAAAVEAVLKAEFAPARDRNRPVGSWIKIPIRFGE